MDEYLEGLEHSKVHSPEEPVYLDSIGILTDSPLSSVATAAGESHPVLEELCGC